MASLTRNLRLLLVPIEDYHRSLPKVSFNVEQGIERSPEHTRELWWTSLRGHFDAKMNEPIRFLVVVRRLFFLTLVVTLVAQCEHNKDGGRTVVGRCTIIPFTSALATSSRNLKKSTQQSRSVVSRLAKAARDAAAAKKRLLEQENNREDVNSTDEKKLPTITNLYAVIDEELLHPKNGNKPSRETSSIRVLLEHNTENEVFLTQGDTDEPTSTPEAQHASTKGRADIKDSRNKGNKLRPHQVAIVFARPQVDGQVTIEYASRLMSLAKLIKYDGYRPDLICFCGSYSFISSVHNGDQPKTEAAVSDTAAGVIFFRHLCAANDIPLVDIDLCMIPEEVQEEASTLIDGIHDDINDGVWNDTLPPESPPLLKMVPSSPSKLFHPVVEELLRSQYLEQWLDQSQVFESETDEYGMTRREPRKKIQIHWTLVSTEYHLCNLNDIHIRSPRQSPLTTLVHEVEQAVSRRFRRGIVKNTWSFRYSAYPYVYYDESDGDGVLIAFLGKCYLMAQGLVPLLVNLRGVAENVSKKEKNFMDGIYFPPSRDIQQYVLMMILSRCELSLLTSI